MWDTLGPYDGVASSCRTVPVSYWGRQRISEISNIRPERSIGLTTIMTPMSKLFDSHAIIFYGKISIYHSDTVWLWWGSACHRAEQRDSIGHNYNITDNRCVTEVLTKWMEYGSAEDCNDVVMVKTRWWNNTELVRLVLATSGLKMCLSSVSPQQ